MFFHFLFFLLFIIIFINLSFSFNIEQQDKTQDFLSWFHDNGGKSNVGISNFPLMGRGIISEKILKDKDELYFVPSNLMFSIKNLNHFLSKSNYFTDLEAKFLEFLQETFKNDHELVLISWFLIEQLKQDNSFFSPYFSLLPSYIPSLIYFSDEDLLKFDRKFDRKFINNFQQEEFQRYNLWKNAIESFSSSISSSNIFDKITKEDYFYTLTIFSSRGLRINGEIFLAPFGDMINYSPHPNPRVASTGKFFLEHHKLTSDGLSILSDRPVEEIGVQVFEDYGDNSNDIYLRYHSFIPDENPHNCVNLNLEYYQLLTNDEKTPIKTQENFNKLIKNLKLPIDHLIFCLGNSTIKLSMATKAYLSILIMTEEDFSRCYKVASDPSSLDWNLIQRVCDFNNRMIKVEQDIKKIEKEGEETLTDLSSLSIGNVLINIIESNIKNWNDENEKISSIQEDEKKLLEINYKLLESYETKDENKVLLHDFFTDLQPSPLTKTLLHNQLALSYTVSEKKMFDSWCSKYNLDCSFQEEVEKNEDKIETENHLIDPIFKAQIDKFNEWISSHLPSPLHQKIKAIPLPPPYRVGTIAIEPIESGSIYLGIPTGLIMSSENSLISDLVVGKEVNESGELVDKIYKNNISKLISSLYNKFNQRDDFHELLLTLIYEKFIRQEDSFYSPYLDVLPKKINLDIPLYWSQEFLDQEFTGSDVRDNIRKYQKEVEIKFNSLNRNEIITNFFSDEAKQKNIENPFTYENYLWATAILDSRSIWWNGKRHLVPLLDFVNCQFRESKVHSTVLDNTGNYAITKADQNYSIGEEVTENYGQPSYIYLTYHGFTLLPQGIDEDNDEKLSLPDYECVPFSIDFSPEEITQLSNNSKVSKFLYVC